MKRAVAKPGQRPARRPRASANWTDLSLNDLFERIRVGMPDDEKGTLTRPQVADLLAVMLPVADMPAGKADVPTEAAALKDIKYLGTKPQTRDARNLPPRHVMCADRAVLTGAA
jgi:hypothetical protein